MFVKPNIKGRLILVSPFISVQANVMKTQTVLSFVICTFCIHGVAPRVMQERFWVESRSPIVSQRSYHHRPHHEVMAQPLMDRKIHNTLPSTKMTNGYDEQLR